MPAGVTENFLTILEREERARIRRLAVAPFLAGAAIFLAELADIPPWGAFVEFTATALAVGLAGGLALAWWRYRRARESIRERWAKWMQWSLAADSLGQLSAKVRGTRSIPPAVVAGALVAGAVLNVLLFVGLWYAWAWVDWLATLVLLADGVAIGAVAADAAWGARWCRSLRGACQELVQAGEVGVWGER